MRAMTQVGEAQKRVAALEMEVAALRDVVSRAVDLWANALAARLKADMVANLIATSGVERAQAHDVPAQAVR